MIHFYLQADVTLLTPPLQTGLGAAPACCPEDGAAELGLTGGWWLLRAAEEIKLELLLAAL